jgi:hypothetical protein
MKNIASAHLIFLKYNSSGKNAIRKSHTFNPETLLADINLAMPLSPRNGVK